MGALEYGLQAVRESAGLGPGSAPLECWRNGWPGVTAEVAQRFGPRFPWNRSGVTTGPCPSRFNDEVKHIKVVEKDNWIHITEAKKFESLLVRVPGTPAAPAPGRGGHNASPLHSHSAPRWPILSA